MASSPVNCSSSTSASSCCSSQLLDEKMDAAEGMGGAASVPSRPNGSSSIWARLAGSGGGAAGCAARGAASGAAGGAAGANAANRTKPAGIHAGAATATTASEPRKAGGTALVARPAGSGGGAASCVVGAADGAARVGCGAGVAGSGGWNCPGTVVGAGGRHGAEVGAQARIPPWPLAGSGVNPALYVAFSASGSAFQRWPGAWQRAGERARERGHRGRGRIRGGNIELGTGGMRGACGAREGAVVAEL
eukprot:scaffold70538_cov56-Phaeocystis_antarctica.AAC.3